MRPLSPTSASPSGDLESDRSRQPATTPEAPDDLDRQANRRRRRLTLAGVLGVASLLLYAATRLWRLADYPITFFPDEAILVNVARKLVDSGWKAADGSWFPFYFETTGNRWAPDFCVYFHAVTSELFGRSIEVMRATGALITVIAAAALAFLLHRFFALRNGWMVILVLAMLPAWFFHSRTAFETVVATSFFALFLLAYYFYRCVSPRYLPLALLAGAVAFYAYSNAQAVAGVTAIFLFLSDLRYHLRHWRHLLIGLVVALVLATPFLLFRADHPDAMIRNLREINSYWFLDIPLSEKLQEYGRRYATGLDPRYWFVHHERDLARHLVNGRAHLPMVLLPFLVLGAGVSLWRVRDTRYRTLVLMALATPAGAATVDVTITRVMAFIVPAALFMTIGLDTLMGWLEGLLRRARFLDRLLPRWAFPIVAFLALSAGAVSLTADAFARGPTWNQDYGLYGMQWGARQIFQGLLPEIYAEHPEADVVLSPNWANAADQFTEFFFDPAALPRVRFENPESWAAEIRPTPPNMLIVAAENEYRNLDADPKLAKVDVLRTLLYPNGSPGFRVLRLAYRDDAADILARAAEERRRPEESVLTIDGQEVHVVHSRLDIGRVNDLFDGVRGQSLARGLEANPLVFDFTFSEPRTMRGLAAAFASMDFSLRVEMWEPPSPEAAGEQAGRGEPIVYNFAFAGPDGRLLLEPDVEVEFDRGPHTVQRLRLSVRNERAHKEAKIHVREIEFR